MIGGPARKSRIISEQEKKVAAYHEAGHALAAWAMPDIEPVYKVTILPRGRTGGHALVVPEDDKELMTRSEMLARLVFAMGGRSAEELVFHEPTTGASSDIEQATKIARAMVTEYGMSAKLGAVKYGQEQGEPFLGRSAGRQNDYSLEVAHEIDEEVRKLIEAAHTEAWDILNVHRDALDALTGELIEHETLQRRDLERIFASVTKRPRITAFNDFGERVPSDRPPIKTRREQAAERGEPWPPPGEQREEPAAVGSVAGNGHVPAPAVNGSYGAHAAGNGSRPVPRKPASRPPRPRARPRRASRTSTAAVPAPARTVAAAVAPPRTSRRRWRRTTVPLPAGRPRRCRTARRGTRGEPVAPAVRARAGQGPGQYGASRPAGESVPNPYGDPDGRTREGRSDGWRRATGGSAHRFVVHGLGPRRVRRHHRLARHGRTGHPSRPGLRPPLGPPLGQGAGCPPARSRKTARET